MAEKAIQQVDEAPICRDPKDLFTVWGRRTIGRVLRPYLDDFPITAMELVFSMSNVRRFEREGDLKSKALNYIANMQARAYGGDDRQRVLQLETLISSAFKRIHEQSSALRQYAELMQENGFDSFVTAVERTVKPANLEFIIDGALATELANYPTWAEKLECLVDHLEEVEREDSVAALDRAVSEVMDSSGAIKDLLGIQDSRYAAIMSLSSIITGRVHKDAHLRMDVMQALRSLVSDMGLRETTDVICERIARELRSIKQLVDGAHGAQTPVFGEIIKILSRREGLYGGPAVAEAITLRAKSVLAPPLADQSTSDAVDSMCEALPTAGVALGYLIDFSATDTGYKARGAVRAAVFRTLEQINGKSDLAEPGEDPEGPVERLKERMKKSNMYEDELDKIREALDALPAVAPHKPLTQAPPERVASGLGERAGSEASGAAPAAPAGAGAAAGDGKAGPPGSKLPRRVLQKGEVLFNEGEAGDNAYLIAHGKLEVVKQDGEKRIHLASLQRGEIVGEMALIDDEPRSATIVASEPTVLSVVPRATLRKKLDWLSETDPVLRRLMGTFVKRLRVKR